MVDANRLNIGEVLKEIDQGNVDTDLWNKAKELSNGIESLVMAKYLQLRAELIAKK